MRTACSVSAIGLLVAMCPDAFAEAENYEQIRVDAGMGHSWVSVSDRRGFGFAAEVKAMMHDHLAIGGRVEMAVMYGGLIGRDEDLPLQFSMTACGLVKAELFLADIEYGLLRPWVGLGAGAYTIGGQAIASGPDHSGISQTTGRYFGAAPQIGIDLGRVRLAATYNMILGATLELRQTIGTVEQTYSYSQNYASVELSLRFGGGRKQKPMPAAYPAPVPVYPQPYPPSQPQPYPPPQPQPYPPSQPQPSQPQPSQLQQPPQQSAWIDQ